MSRVITINRVKAIGEVNYRQLLKIPYSMKHYTTMKELLRYLRSIFGYKLVLFPSKKRVKHAVFRPYSPRKTHR